MKKFFENTSDPFWAIFRILVGFLFFAHGAQKLLGWFTDNATVQLMSLFGLAGIIEIVVGILLILGLFAKYAALLGALEMIGAYVQVHLKTGILPWNNGGELALLYMLAFLAIMSKGPGIWAIDKSK